MFKKTKMIGLVVLLMVSMLMGCNGQTETTNAETGKITQATTSSATGSTKSADEVVRSVLNGSYQEGDSVKVSGLISRLSISPKWASENIGTSRMLRNSHRDDKAYGWFIELKLSPDLRDYTLMCYFETREEITKSRELVLGQSVTLKGEIIPAYFDRNIIIGNCQLLSY